MLPNADRIKVGTEFMLGETVWTIFAPANFFINKHGNQVDGYSNYMGKRWWAVDEHGTCTQVFCFSDSARFHRYKFNPKTLSPT